jgi:hypothetical protein
MTPGLCLQPGAPLRPGGSVCREPPQRYLNDCLSLWSLPNVVADIVRLVAVTGFPQEYRFT